MEQEYYYEYLREFMGVFILIAVVIVAVALIYSVCYVIGSWKIFEKAGEAGWKSLIPLYDYYIRIKISWNTGMFWVWLVLSVLGGVMGLNQHLNVIILGVLIRLGAYVIRIISAFKLAKVFEHGVGFAIGLALLEPFFLLILGLDQSEYHSGI